MSTHPQPVQEDLRREAVQRIQKRHGFYRHLLAYVLVNIFLIIIWAITGAGFFWPAFVLFGWGIGLVFNAFDVFTRHKPSEAEIDSEMERMNRG